MKVRKRNDIELTIDEQNGRMQIILIGIASILLVNITAVVIVVSFHWSVLEMLNSRALTICTHRKKVSTVMYRGFHFRLNKALFM